MSWHSALILFLASALAGAVNAVAGGGTLLTFPALLWSGHTAIVANATSTVALWPGQLSSLYAYRSEMTRSKRAMILLGIPSFLGGIIGAIALLKTPESVFDRIVPYLILGATMLFMVQEPLSRLNRKRAEAAAGAGAPTDDHFDPAPSAWAGIMLFQVGIAIYGGYFGAGIGIITLAALGFVGFRNIHQMNGLKNVNALCINAVAAALFIANRLVDWRIALLMAVASIIGGYAGAGTARRMGQRNVRRLVIAIGLALTLNMLLRHPTPAPAQPAPHAKASR
jgi:uncharacterized membrane protein YfcA